MANLSRNDMIAVINAGGSVVFNGRLYKTTSSLPTQNEIDAFIALASGAVGFARDTETYTTASLANNASENGTVPLGKTFMLVKISTTVAARVRVYTTAAYRTADAARAIGTEPTGEHGLVAEVVTTSGNLSIDLAPFAFGGSLESTPVSDISIAVENRSGGASAVGVTFTFLMMEVA